MALFHRHKQVDAVLTAVAWRRATDIQHGDWLPMMGLDWDDNPVGPNIRKVPPDQVATVGSRYEERHWRAGRVVETSGDSQEGVY